MPAHVFVSDRTNFDVCLRRGIVGIPSAVPGSRNESATNDALISRMSIIRDGDYVLFYVTSDKALYGIFQIDGTPFYDDAAVWENDLYPYRVRFKATPFHYAIPLKLHDIYDLQNEGRIWSFALKRASGSNAMFSLSNQEFSILQSEYSKLNPFSNQKQVIWEPYPVKTASLLDRIHLEDDRQIKYEAGTMAYLLSELTNGRYKDIFGNYTDYLSYVPTTIGSEMDILLMFGNPMHPDMISSYDILELKRDVFDEKALAQLIGYETWFLQKKVRGDQKMVRATAIARKFSPDVIRYVRMRNRIEGKNIKLLRYDLDVRNNLSLTPVE